MTSTGSGAGTTGSIEQALEKMQAKLLDLSARNRLVHFKHTAGKGLKCFSGDVDLVFDKLTSGTGSGQVEIRALPEPKASDYLVKAGRTVRPEPTEWARRMGIPLNQDIDLSNSSLKTDELQSIYYDDDLGKHCRKLDREARLSIEETGSNMLFLVLGFLEYPDVPGSDRLYSAPLVSVPVSFQIKGSGKMKYSLSYTGDDVGENYSLQEKLRRDHNLELPEFGEADSTVSGYLERVRLATKEHRGFTVQYRITTALISFSNMLLVRDLDPANWPGGVNSNQLIAHPLVRHVFQGAPSSDHGHEPFAEDHKVDTGPGSDLPLVFDADSSQHSALIDAIVHRRNLVIQGPPGTGKSQTIANLIAAAISEGRTVLFVAEKLAALQVVKNRLEKAGLGDFLLELHSNKTSKKQVLDSLANRYMERPKPKVSLDAQLEQLRRYQNDLVAYMEAINAKIDGPIDSTVQQVFWKVEKFRRELGQLSKVVETLRLEETDKYTLGRIAESVEVLDEMGRMLSEVGSFDKSHLWWGFYPKALEPGAMHRIKKLIETLRMHITMPENLIGDLKVILYETPDRPRWRALKGRAAQILSPFSEPNALEVGGSSIEELLEKMGSFDSQLKSLGAEGDVGLRILQSRPLAQDSLDAATATFEQLKTNIQDWTSSLECVTRTIGSSEETASRVLLVDPHESIQVLRVNPKDTVDQVLEKWGELSLALQDSQLAHRQASQVAMRMDLCSPDNLEQIQAIKAYGNVLEQFPTDCIELYTLDHLGPRTSSQYHEFVSLSQQYLSRKTLLVERLYLDLAPTVAEIEAAVRKLRAGGGLVPLFDADWTRALNLHKSVARSKERKSTVERITELMELREFVENESKLKSHPLTERVGGMDQATNLALLGKLSRLIDWCTLFQSKQSQFPSERIDTKNLAPARVLETIAIWNQLAPALEVLVARLASLETLAAELKLTPEPEGLTGFEDLSRFLKVLLDQGEGYLVKLRALGLPKHSMETLALAQTNLIQLENLRASFADEGQYREFFGSIYQREDSDTAVLNTALALAKQLLLRDWVPTGVVSLLWGEELSTRVERVQRVLRHLEKSELAVLDFENQMVKLGELETLDFLQPSASTDLGEAQRAVLARLEALEIATEKLYPWSNYIRVRSRAEHLDLSAFVNLVESGVIEREMSPVAFQYVFWLSIAAKCYRQSPVLSSFSGIRQTKIREEFQRVDREVIAARGKSILASVPSVRLPPGENGVRVDEKTEGALLSLLFTQSRPRMPVRKFLRRARRSVQLLKPCFMMGPQAVAQFLEPGAITFDLIIMDEASQLPPEEAIGAVARGSQLVVVGDSKQLPPTSFFSRGATEDDEEHLMAIDSESILDVCSNHFRPSRMLKWHYRSRHQSLISFSNKHFYDDHLVIFPSPYANAAGLGVRSIYVESGVYESQCNTIEAERVVAEMVRQIEAYPKNSLGIATLNVKQRDLIEEIFLARHSQRKTVQDFQKYWASESEPLFVKNLENVQGDERDSIIISTTFGPSPGTRSVKQNFGPINSEGGWRRLNVLFTRARRIMTVVTSMRPEQIVADPSGKSGATYLRAYLEFAQKGVLEIPQDTDREPESDFESSVMAHLQRLGYSVTPQLGVAGYRIDLAVRHPKYPTAYLAAIECDGATYHSAPSARDRDRIRQEILESMGWQGRIWRNWSTDWFNTPERELERLATFLTSLETTWQPEHEAELGSAKEPPESAEASSGELPVPPEAPEVDLDFDDEISVEVGDKVFYVETNHEDVTHEVTISLDTNDPDAGIVPRTKPIAKALLGAAIDEVVVLAIPGEHSRTFRVVRIDKQDSVESFAEPKFSRPQETLDSSEKRTTLRPAHQEELFDGLVSTSQPPVDNPTIYQDPKLWFSLAHWAKVGDHLTPFLRKAAADFGRKVNYGGLSDRQKSFMRSIYLQASDAGFVWEPQDKKKP